MFSNHSLIITEIVIDYGYEYYHMSTICIFQYTTNDSPYKHTQAKIIDYI